MAGNTLTLNGASYAAAKFGQGLSGGVASAGAVPPATYTVEGWLYLASTPSALGVAFSFDGGSWVGVNSDGKLYVSSDGSPARPVFSNGVWHHVALCHDGGFSKVWLDGVLVITTSDPTSPGALRLRDYSASGGYAFSGVVDEVAVWAGIRYTDAGFTPPTAPYSGSEANLLALHHLNGDGADSQAAGTGPLAIGALTAVGTAAGVTLALSAGLSGGSGAGYSYAIYRGTDPDFVVGPATLLTTQAGLPYTDATAAEGVSYYYGLIGSDGAGAAVNALPAGMSAIAATPAKLLYACSARLTAPPLAIVFIGTSVTAGAGLPAVNSITADTVPAATCAELRRRGVRRPVAGSNQGVNGSLVGQWVPASGSGYYANARAAMQALLVATPTAIPVFSIELGTNDSPTRSAAAFVADLKVIVDQLRADFPAAKIVLQRPIWFSPTTRNGVAYEQAALSRLATYLPAVAALVASYPGGVFAGDQIGYQVLAESYLAYFQVENGANGAFYIHPNAAGAAVLGDLWASAIDRALFGGGTTIVKRLFRSMAG